MLLVDNVDDRAYLCGLFDAMVDDLPTPLLHCGKCGIGEEKR